jgi:hypothetical protein
MIKNFATGRVLKGVAYFTVKEWLKYDENTMSYDKNKIIKFTGMISKLVCVRMREGQPRLAKNQNSNCSRTCWKLCKWD